MLNEEEKDEWPEVEEIHSVKKEEEGNSDTTKKKRCRKNKFIRSEEKIEEVREAQVHATRAQTKAMEEKTQVEDKQVEREGVISHDLEAVHITSQDSMPVQSTPDGVSIDLPTPQLVKLNEGRDKLVEEILEDDSLKSLKEQADINSNCYLWKEGLLCNITDDELGENCTRIVFLTERGKTFL